MRSPLQPAVVDAQAMPTSNDRHDHRHEIFEERHNHRDLQQQQHDRGNQDSNHENRRDPIGEDRQLFAGNRQLLVDVFYEQQQRRQPARDRGRIEDERDASSPEEEPINEDGKRIR